MTVAAETAGRSAPNSAAVACSDSGAIARRFTGAAGASVVANVLTPRTSPNCADQYARSSSNDVESR